MLSLLRQSRVRLDRAVALLAMSAAAGGGCSTFLGLDDYKITGGTAAGAGGAGATGAGNTGAATSSGGAGGTGMGGTGSGGSAMAPGDVLSAAQTGDVANLTTENPPAEALSVAFDTDGRSCIAARLNAKVNFGDGQVGDPNFLALACYDAAGTLIGSPEVTTAAVSNFAVIGVDFHRGSAMWTAGFQGYPYFAGQPIGAADGTMNGTAIRFTVAEKEVQYSAGPWNFRGDLRQWGSDVAFIPGTGDAVLLGGVEGSTILGKVISGNFDFFAARIQKNTSVAYAVTPPGMPGGLQLGKTIAAAADGSAFIAGTYDTTFTLAGTTLPQPATGISYIFAANVQDEDFQWAHSVQAGSNNYPTAVTIDATNNRWMAMIVDGPPSIDSTPIAMPQCTLQGRDVGLFAWDPDGNLHVARCFGASGDQRPIEIAADTEGNIFVVGYFEGSIDFGIKMLIAQGNADAFVAKIDATGNPRWAKHFYSSSTDSMTKIARALGVGVDQDGFVHVLGTVVGDLMDADTMTTVSMNTCGGCEQLFFLTLAP